MGVGDFKNAPSMFEFRFRGEIVVSNGGFPKSLPLG